MNTRETAVFIGGASVGLALSLAAMKLWKVLKNFDTASVDLFDATISAQPRIISDKVLKEQFVRNVQFFGEDGQSKVASARVIVVGLGGVGSHCAVALARSGVRNIRLIDFDRVTVSSLNRHASATWSHVGIPKVESLKRFIHEFAPFSLIDSVEELFSLDQAKDLILSYKPDFVIDCIDNVPTKADLLGVCLQHKIPVICACGSACKKDFTKIRLASLDEVTEDELARAVRQRLAKNGFKKTGIPAVFSSEKNDLKLLPLKKFQEKNPKNFQVLEKFRVRILPVISPLPAIMGNSLASYVLCEFAGVGICHASSRDPLTKQKKMKLIDLIKKQGIFFPETFSDEYLELRFQACHGKSVISGKQSSLVFMLWKRPFTENSGLVLMTREEAENHMNNQEYAEDVYEKISCI